ncbi:MAG: TlpA family protein disulfide reductase [Actinocrinis sp.]
MKAAQRSAAPTLSGTSLEGKNLALSDYRGKYVVVNVWGSWCTPCRIESPGLEETYQKYQSKGVQFLGLNTHDDNAAALAFVAADKITYPSFQDPDETLLLQFKSVVPPTSIPSTIIVDPNGKVAARIIGVVTEPQLIQTLDQVLGGH